MIYHVFNGRQIHLAPSISKGFITVYAETAASHIVIIGGNTDNKMKYIEMFRSLGFERYSFISTLLQFAFFIRKTKNSAVLLHGCKHEWNIIALAFGGKNVNWVCWGSGSSMGNNWKSKLVTPIKRYLYQKFNTIVTLMEDDKSSMIKDFHVNPEKIETISYASSGPEYPFDHLLDQLLGERRLPEKKPLLLLGNSPHEMHNYIDMLHRLAHLKGKIRVQCMNNYSLKRGKLYNQLIATGQELFGDDFRSNEEFYSNLSDYYHYMNSCDVYICSSISQTGLGAIGTCLRLGKKIYANGKNLNWMRSHYGVLIFDTNIITNDISFEDITNPLNQFQKLQNSEIMKKQRIRDVEMWIIYLAKIDKANS